MDWTAHARVPGDSRKFRRAPLPLWGSQCRITRNGLPVHLAIPTSRLRAAFDHMSGDDARREFVRIRPDAHSTGDRPRFGGYEDAAPANLLVIPMVGPKTG